MRQEAKFGHRIRKGGLFFNKDLKVQGVCSAPGGDGWKRFFEAAFSEHFQSLTFVKKHCFAFFDHHIVTFCCCCDISETAKRSKEEISGQSFEVAYRDKNAACVHKGKECHKTVLKYSVSVLLQPEMLCRPHFTSPSSHTKPELTHNPFCALSRLDNMNKNVWKLLYISLFMNLM